MIILAKLQNMAASEILNIVPEDLYREIKEKDPHPVFRAYVVGHEGETSPTIIGVGQRVLTWFSSAINMLVKKIQYGTKVFFGHNEDSTHEGRKVIGEIVGKTVKTIKDRINAVVVTYIHPDYKGLPLDIASIEADIVLNGDNVHGANIEVGEITGLALGNSSVEKPGFPGATLLSELQAFADKSTTQFIEGGKMVTISEVRTFIKAENLKPSDIFGLGDLMKDSMVSEALDKEKKKAVTGEYEHRKRDEEGFDKTKDKMEADHKKAVDKMDVELKKLRGDIGKTKAADLFATKAKERKLSDQQQKYIDLKKDGFVSEDLEKLPQEVDSYMDARLEDFKKEAEIFGHKEESTSGKKGGGEPGSEEEGKETLDFIP